jgi:hypothetical protein
MFLDIFSGTLGSSYKFLTNLLFCKFLGPLIHFNGIVFFCFASSMNLAEIKMKEVWTAYLGF